MCVLEITLMTTDVSELKFGMLSNKIVNRFVNIPSLHHVIRPMMSHDFDFLRFEFHRIRVEMFFFNTIIDDIMLPFRAISPKWDPGKKSESKIPRGTLPIEMYNSVS